MKVLNLDALTKSPTRTLIIDGKEYAVNEMTVGDFIEAQKDTKLIEANKNDSQIWMEATVRFIQRAFPTMPVERIQKFTIEEMSIIVKFINGELEAEAVKATEGEQGKDQTAG